MKYTRALVTGGAGFIGSHITEKLLAEGVAVTVIDDLSVGTRENVPEGARLVVGDIRDLPLMKELARETDIVFHEAAKVSIRASIDQCHEDADINLMGTLNLLRACEGSPVKKIVLASSMAVYADSPEPIPVSEDAPTEPLSPYGVAKLASEKYCQLLCRQYGIDLIVLRYFNTFGPRQTFTPYVGVITIFINKLLAGETPVIFGDGNQMRDFVYVGDIAQANILAMKSELSEGVFNVGTGRRTTVNEIAKLLKSRLNPHLEIPHAEEQAGELKISFADISRTQEHLGYQPQWSIEDRIEEVIDFIKQRGRDS